MVSLIKFKAAGEGERPGRPAMVLFVSASIVRLSKKNDKVLVFIVVSVAV
jgi:hypothetical protein